MWAMIGLLLIAPAHAQSPEWQKYEPKDHGFSIDMPGKPEIEPIAPKGTNGPGETAVFALNKSEPAKTVGFVTIYVEHSRRPDNEVVLDRITKKFTGTHKITSIEKETVDGYPARQYIMESNNIKTTLRAVMTDKYLIQAIVSGPSDTVMVKRFLDSLKIATAK